MISNNVVTLCFLGLVIDEVVIGVGEFSSENVSSRSPRLNAVYENDSLHMVDATFGASTLFQKKGLSLLVGRTALDFLKLVALGGSGGMPGGGGGGRGAPDNGGGGGGGGGGGNNAGPSKE